MKSKKKCCQNSGLQGETSSSRSHFPPCLASGGNKILPLSGNSHLPGPKVGAKYQLPHQDSTAEYVPPPVKGEPAEVNDSAVLLLTHSSLSSSSILWYAAAISKD